MGSEMCIRDRAYQDSEGVYLLYQGSYVLLNQEHVKIAEIFNEHFGLECLWNEKSLFHVKPLTFEHKYMWLSKETLLSAFPPELVGKLKDHQGRKDITRK